MLVHILSNIPGIARTGLTFFTSKAPHWRDFFGRGLREFAAVGWWCEVLRWWAHSCVVLSFYFKKQNYQLPTNKKNLVFLLTHQFYLSWWHFHYWFFQWMQAQPCWHGGWKYKRVSLWTLNLFHCRLIEENKYHEDSRGVPKFEGFSKACNTWMETWIISACRSLWHDSLSL